MGNKELILVKEGIDLYKSIRNEIPMSTPFYPMGIPNHNSNVICLGFNYSMCRRIALWCFDDADREITVPIEYNNAKIIYPSDTKITISHENNGLNVKFPAECMSVIIELN